MHNEGTPSTTSLAWQLVRFEIAVAVLTALVLAGIDILPVGESLQFLLIIGVLLVAVATVIIRALKFFRTRSAH